MKRNLLALVVLLAAASLFCQTDDRLPYGGIRPGMTRAEVERRLDLVEQLEPDVRQYHVPHQGPGCHCECPRLTVWYENGRVRSLRN